MSVILVGSEGLPFPQCPLCGYTEGMETEDYKIFTCPECGWEIELS
jgi:transposase